MEVQLQIKIYTMQSTVPLSFNLKTTLSQVLNTLKEYEFIQKQIHNSRFILEDYKGNLVSLDKTVQTLHKQGQQFFVQIGIKKQQSKLSTKLSQSRASEKFDDFSLQNSFADFKIKKKSKKNDLIETAQVINAIDSIKILQFQDVELMHEQEIINPQLYQCLKELQQAFIIKNQIQQKHSDQINFIRQLINKITNNRPLEQIKAFAKSRIDSCSYKTKQSVIDLVKRSQIFQSRIALDNDKQSVDVNTQQLNTLRRQKEQVCQQNLGLKKKMGLIQQEFAQLKKKILKKEENEPIKAALKQALCQLQKLKIKHQHDIKMLKQKNDQLIKMQEDIRILKIKVIQKQDQAFILNQYQKKITELQDIIVKNRFSDKLPNNQLQKNISQNSILAIQSKIMKNSRQKQLATLKKIINQTLVSQQVQSFQMLYSFDPLNKTNFHKYIDEKNNFLLIAETEKQNIIGGFCRDPLLPNKKGSIQSCLFSLTKRKGFRLRRKQAKGNQENSLQAYIYDPYFLVFGNDELMIQVGKNQIETANLSSVKGSFDIEQADSRDFLGQGQNRVKAKLIHYQILQVITRPK